jgi:hypothetical protein
VKLIDLAGQRFGRLTVLRQDGHHGKEIMWACRCDCGVVVRTWGAALRTGNSKSCGCLKLEINRQTRVTHGFTRELARPREYHSWRMAKDRCYGVTRPSYRRYGGRGIVMCDEWRYDFARFYADMGPRPAGTSLDRIDNDGPYAPWNCRWATRAEQNRNTSAALRSTR